MTPFFCVFVAITFAGRVSSLQYYREGSLAEPRLYLPPNVIEAIVRQNDASNIADIDDEDDFKIGNPLRQIIPPDSDYLKTLYFKNDLRRKKNFDEIDKAGFPGFTKREFDEIDKASFPGFNRKRSPEDKSRNWNFNRYVYPGVNKKNFDEIDKSAFSEFNKRNFDEIDKTSLSGFNKKNFDEIDKTGFSGFNKRNFDEIDKTSLSGFSKRNFDEIDKGGFPGFNKRGS